MGFLNDEGHENLMLFTWSEDKTKWAIGDWDYYIIIIAKYIIKKRLIL